MGIEKARNIITLRLEEKELEKSSFLILFIFLEMENAKQLVEMKMVFKSGWINLDTSGKEPAFQKDPLEKGLATHSSILAWRILWTEEPGGIQFIGSQRVGHN